MTDNIIHIHSYAVSDWYLIPNEQFFRHIIARTNYISMR